MNTADRAARLKANARRREMRGELRRAKRIRQTMLADPNRTAEEKRALDAVAMATVDLLARRCREAGVNVNDLVGPSVGVEPPCPTG